MIVGCLDGSPYVPPSLPGAIEGLLGLGQIAAPNNPGQYNTVEEKQVKAAAKGGMKKAMPKAGMPPAGMPKAMPKAGMHMMPDGMPMSDADHKKMMGGKKR